MTKKHFIRLAEYIKDAAKYADVPFTQAQINHLADFCHEANPMFKRERWLDYIAGNCGKNGGKPLPPKRKRTKNGKAARAWGLACRPDAFVDVDAVRIISGEVAERGCAK